MAGRVIALVALIAVSAVYGCGGKKSAGGTPAASEPDYVTVQHILIGFEGTLPDKNITRSKSEASALARELYERAEAGEDFDTLVEEYTDDSVPGVYGIANHDGQPDQARQIYARSDMAQNFGDVSFSLEVGGIGLAEYHEKHCKYGWHVIVRIK